MLGSTNVKEMLLSLDARLNEGVCAYVHVSDLTQIPADARIATFREQEGWTAIIEQSYLDKLGLTSPYLCSWITLTVHSALEAVGLTAAVSAALTKANISCNVVAAYYHDHIFVPTKDAERAVRILNSLGDTE